MNSRPSSAIVPPGNGAASPDVRPDRAEATACTPLSGRPLQCYVADSAHRCSGSVTGVAVDRIECRWCHAHNDGGTSCQVCGAPLDTADRVSDSGWREAPRLRDMTEFHFSNSTCQVEGELVPVAEVTLGPGDGVFFEHH